VAKVAPGAFQVHVPCAGHFENGPHFRCMEHGTIEALKMVEAAASGSGWSAKEPQEPRIAECVVGGCEPTTIRTFPRTREQST